MHSEQINELAKALAEAQQKIKSAHKDASNPFHKSRYADLSSVWDAAKDALNCFGLSIVQTLEKDALNTMLLHTSGQWISGSCPLINQKGDMQGLGSAITYARRYSIAAICGVVNKDDDDDANSADLKILNPALKAPSAVPPQVLPSSPGSNKASTEKPAGGHELISEKQEKLVFAKCKAAGLANSKEISDFLAKTIGVFHTSHIARKDLDKVLGAIDKIKDVGDIPF